MKYVELNVHVYRYNYIKTRHAVHLCFLSRRLNAVIVECGHYDRDITVWKPNIYIIWLAEKIVPTLEVAPYETLQSQLI